MIFRRRQQAFVRACYRMQKIFDRKIAKVVHDKLIVYEKDRGNDISEAQSDPKIALKLKVKDCGYLITNVNKRLRFKYNTKFIQNESV